MAITGFRIVITAGMGRFLRVIPQPNRMTNDEEKGKILAAFRRLWPNSEAYWTPDESAILGAHGKPFSGRPSELCCQMLYVGLNGNREPITDQQAINLIAAELRKTFPGIQV